MGKKKILLTGATGFLGSHLASSFVNDYDIVILKRRKSNTIRINSILPQLQTVDLEEINYSEFFKKDHFSGVIHCATNYGRDENDLNDTIEANLTLPLNLLKNAFENNVEFFINTDTILDKRINYYSLSKSHFKDWFLFFSHRIKSINIELEHFYGQGDDPTKFVSKIINELAGNEDKTIDLTRGEQKRSFIHIDDVVSAFRTILNNLDQIQTNYCSFQVGSKQQISIKEFVVMVKELCGNTKTRLNFGALPYRNNEVMEVNLDVSRLEALGWGQKIPLNEGLQRTITFEKKF